MSNGVSVSGTMQNILHQGFSVTDAVCEGIDNSFDAHATVIDIRYDHTKNGLFIADNGSGMTPDKLPEAYVMNNRSDDVDTTNEKHGRFGIGANVLPIVLTELLGNMSVVTKTAEMNYPCDMNMNFPRAIATGVFNREVNTVDQDGTDNRSANSIQVWNEYSSVTQNHSGTILSVKLSERVSRELNEKINESTVFRDLTGKQYHKSIENGAKIYLNNELVPAIDYLDRNNATHTNTLNVVVRNIDGIPRACVVQQKRGVDTEVYFTQTATSNGKKKATYINVDADANEPIGKFTITSTFDPSWTGNALIKNGGLYLERKNKLVKHFPSEKVLSGDHARRPIIEAGRHEISFNGQLDDAFGVLVNKSDLRKEGIAPTIIDFINQVTTDYTNTLYKDHYKIDRSTAANGSDADDNSVASYVGNAARNNTNGNQDDPTVDASGQNGFAQIQLDNLHANDIIEQVADVQTAEEVDTLPIERTIVRPSPPVVVLGIRFALESRQHILSIEDADTNIIIARTETYGEGSSLRKWLCAKLRSEGNETFLEFIRTNPMFTLNNRAAVAIGENV
jgi:hypothetical protein